jgi:adenosine kinase
MKNILVSGSIAYDHIMFHKGKFENSLIPEEFGNLSVSFLADSREKFFGGCATNIAYTLSLLGESPIILGIAGNDFDEYKNWLKRNQISTKCIQIDNESPTAAAYILADNEHNQISIFSPGASNSAKFRGDFSCCDLPTIDFAVLAPNVPDKMLAIAEHLIREKIPFIFDPGQAISALSKEYLAIIIEGCEGILANEYETSLLEEKMRMNFDQITNWAGFYIETLGENGCTIFESGKQTDVPAVGGLQIEDVTGCGDAFRSGFVHGYIDGKSLKESCEMACTAASFVVGKRGTQTHSFTKEEFDSRLKEFY